jgi:hypothetical protein
MEAFLNEYSAAGRQLLMSEVGAQQRVGDPRMSRVAHNTSLHKLHGHSTSNLVDNPTFSFMPSLRHQQMESDVLVTVLLAEKCPVGTLLNSCCAPGHYTMMDPPEI